MPYLASFIISVITFVGLYNYLPLDLVAFNQGVRTFGSTITTIQGSDTLSASRSVINTNFSNLNDTKIENSTTSVKAITTLPSLSSIGTILTGVWNASTITVPFGGTGSTTLGSNLVLLGNAASNIKTVTGLGNSGEVLMSNGAGTAPSWQSSSVNQTVPYTWTAHHIFSSLFATNASSTNATTTNLHVSGRALGNIGATTTIFLADGTWTKPEWAVFVEVIAIGGGGGGKGGGTLDGGGGGGGGAYARQLFLADALGSTESVTVGVGGAGGAPAATGTASTFGTFVTARGGSPGINLTGGAGGTSWSGGESFAGGAGGNAQVQGTDSTTDPSPRGGGGGGNSAGTGGTGGSFITNYTKSGGSGGAGCTGSSCSAGHGSSGTDTSSSLLYGGVGGGGGGGVNPVSGTGTPGNGANGSFPGGGGGGGGECTTGGGGSCTGGNGGNGAAGMVVVISYR